MIAEQERAHALCTKLLAFAGPLQHAEEIDAATGGHLGNFPQAFTNMPLIDAVSRPSAAPPRPREREGNPSLTTEHDDRRWVPWQ